MLVKNTFAKSLPITAKALSEKFGVTVSFEEGAVPSTDGKGITLPVIEDDSQVEDKLALIGSLVHECSHVRNTSFDAKFTRDLPKGVFSGLNAIEDLRIEAEACRQYPGAGYMLTAAAKGALKDFDWEKLSQAKMSLAFFYAMLYAKQHLQKDFQGKFLLEYEEAERAARKALGDKIVDSINDLLTKELNTLRSTEDALGLTEKIFALFDKKTRQRKQNQGQNGQQNQSQSKDQQGQGQGNGQSNDAQGQNQDQNQGQQNQGEGQSQSSGNGSNSDNGNQQQDGNSANAEGQPQNGSADQHNGSNGSNGYQMPQGVSRESMRNRNKGFDNPLDISGYMKKTLEHTGSESSSMKMPNFDPSKEPTEDEILEAAGVGHGCGFPKYMKEDAKALEDKAGALTAGLSRGIRGLVQTMSMKPSCTGYTGKRLDYSNISRIANWDLRVFKKVSPEKSKRTIVHILMDRSGSMEGEAMDMAKAVSVALYQAVARIPEAKAHLSSFPGNYPSYRTTEVPLGGNLKKLMPAVARISATGGTPFLEAIEQERQLMNRQDADKKVLIVITDGDTGSSRELTKLLKGRLKKNGIVCGAVGINTYRDSGLEEFFGENFISVRELNKLPAEFMGLAKKMLLNK